MWSFQPPPPDLLFPPPIGVTSPFTHRPPVFILPSYPHTPYPVRYETSRIVPGIHNSTCIGYREIVTNLLLLLSRTKQYAPARIQSNQIRSRDRAHFGE
jgi:hypothetical protein